MQIEFAKSTKNLSKPVMGLGEPVVNFGATKGKASTGRWGGGEATRINYSADDCWRESLTPKTLIVAWNHEPAEIDP